MKLKNILLDKKSDILKRWFDLILETYPSETSGFLKNQQNRFANPVGSSLFEGIEGIFDEILGQRTDSAKVSTFLESIIKIRAIQDFTPSQAVAFIFMLKNIFREELENEIPENQVTGELSVLDSQIDDLALLSFDIYMKYREKIYEMKANEVKNMTFRLLQRADLLHDAQEQEQAPGAGTTVHLKTEGIKE
jgi:hypothetical protein